MWNFKQDSNIWQQISKLLKSIFTPTMVVKYSSYRVTKGGISGLLKNPKARLRLSIWFLALLSPIIIILNQQFFLQGMTVVEEGNEVTLIDGQQRTTTLYLLLWCLDPKNIIHKDISLNYSIRKQSKEFLEKLKEPEFDYNTFDPDNKIQDIYYFKQAISQINKLIAEITDRTDFLNYLLNKISLLYIVIDRTKAVRTFTMMNGQKAIMHDEELIKAEILHIVSLPEEIKGLPKMRSVEDTYAVLQEIISVEWENNALRSKYAREWDKWLYWWNRKDVKEFFNVNKPMGLLLEYYFKKESGSKNEFSYKSFKQLILDVNKNGYKTKAKEVFKGLRDLQKEFEDVFNAPTSYNYLKLSLIGSTGEAEDKYNIIIYFLEHKRNYEAMNDYAKWRLVGCTHKEIVEEYTIDAINTETQTPNSEKRVEKAKIILEKLSKSHVYNVANDEAFKQLLWLNVTEYNRLNAQNGVKFDFSIWENKSLEHIYPKSKFFHTEYDKEHDTVLYIRGDGKEIEKDQISELKDSQAVFSNNSRYSEHCIGNLVLLYGINNSEFGNLPFEEKKQKFFNNERCFESRNLLHTISSFASSNWEIEDIEKSADKFLELFKKLYNLD